MLFVERRGPIEVVKLNREIISENDMKFLLE